MLTFYHLCFVLLCFSALVFYYFYFFAGFAFTRTCPAVLACPRYPLNALYEKAVCLRSDCHFPPGVISYRLLRCFCFLRPLQKAFTRGIYVGRAIQRRRL